MSINEAVKSYIEENPDTNKSTFLKMMADIFTTVKESMKDGKKKEKVIKKETKGSAIEKPEKKLNAYQIFMKEQMPLLQTRENETKIPGGMELEKETRKRSGKKY